MGVKNSIKDHKETQLIRLGIVGELKYLFNNRLTLLMMLHSLQNADRVSILTDFIEWNVGEAWNKGNFNF